MRKNTRAAIAAASVLTLALTGTACTSDGAADSESGPQPEQGPAVVLEGGWAKATDSRMSGVFGTVRNTSEDDVHLTGVSGEIDGSHELHETVPDGGAMMMQEKEDGFVIPAGGDLVLEPGGDHIMLMGLDEPVTTGQQIVLTLEFADGAEHDVTVSARAFEGGQENYVPEGNGGHGGHGADHDNDDNDDVAEEDDEHRGAAHDE